MPGKLLFMLYNAAEKLIGEKGNRKRKTAALIYLKTATQATPLFLV